MNLQPDGVKKKPILYVRDLRREFDTGEAVAGISFALYPGSVTGFIGPNGAGKTTTMRILATLDTPTSGTVLVNGIDAGRFPDVVRKKIGWMPDHIGRYERTSVHEYLDFYARAFGCCGQELKTRIEKVAALTDLVELLPEEIQGLSKGQAQRLSLARMLIHEPEILIMDEPAAGLDPRARLELKSLIRRLAGERRAIFISSHILSDLEDMCDTILFIDRGSIVHDGSIEALKRLPEAETIVRIEVAGDADPLAGWIAANAGIRLLGLEPKGCRVAIDSGDPHEVSSFLRRMQNDGIAVLGFTREERRLEDAFVSLVKSRAQRSMRN